MACSRIRYLSQGRHIADRSDVQFFATVRYGSEWRPPWGHCTSQRLHLQMVVDCRGVCVAAIRVSGLLRPGSVEVRRPPLGGKNEGSIPVVLGFFLRSLIPIVESVRA